MTERPSHADLQRDLGRVEGTLIELRSRGDAHDVAFAAIRAEMSTTREDIAAMGEAVRSVKETGEQTAEKVDRLVGIFDQGKGALRAFVTFRRIVVGAVIAAAGIIAWLASNWASVKRFLGMGA